MKYVSQPKIQNNRVWIVVFHCVACTHHHTNATPCPRALPLRLLQCYQVCKHGGRVLALVKSIPLKKLIHITIHTGWHKHSQTQLSWQFRLWGIPLKNSTIPTTTVKWGLLDRMLHGIASFVRQYIPMVMVTHPSWTNCKIADSKSLFAIT